MIRIVADSTCDLSKELIDKYNIEIIPLHIVMGDKEFKDGVDIQPDEIYKWADENNATPKTSAVSFDDVINVLQPIIEAGDEVICFTISEKMSTTANVFRMVAKELSSRHKISIVDSANLSTGIGHLIVETAIMVEEGMKRLDIVSAVEKMRDLVKASFVVDTLTYLHRGGRCSGVAALAGGMLNLHPMIVVEKGSMEATKKYRGKMNKVILNYVRDMEEDLKKAKKQRVFITHSKCDEEIISDVKEYLENLNYFEEIIETDASCVICSHCGPGTLGVLYIAQE